MELSLNIAWALFSLLGIGLWLRFGDRHRSERYRPLIALAMLLLILFPAVSVSDDLWYQQNPAEVDAALRRDHSVAAVHALFPAVAVPAAAFAGLELRRERSLESTLQASLPAGPPAFNIPQNRPPPAA
ncbi:MAG TPA: hypothetical protein VE291_10410 [Terracidiphilus sp.]|jgi:ABC-type Co2+ transport system permease subunit|nr:hypothetical protein [Terracidiphilus sp.]